SGHPLTPVEVDPHIVAHPHRQAGPSVDAIEPRLGAAPNTHSTGKPAENRARKRKASIDERVAPPSVDDAALQVGVQDELPNDRPAVDAAFSKKCEGVAPGAGRSDALAALGGQPDRNAADRLHAH